MAYDMTTFNVTRPAGADLTTVQYHCVKQTNTGAVVPCSVIGERVFGIVLNDPRMNETATVAVQGVMKVMAGAAISIGAEVMTNASGRVITATADKRTIGEAMTAATANGEYVTVLLRSGVAA